MKQHFLIIKVWDIENQVYAEMKVLNNLTPEQIKDRLSGSRFQFDLIRTLQAYYGGYAIQNHRKEILNDHRVHQTPINELISGVNLQDYCDAAYA